jgi:protein ImuB
MLWVSMCLPRLAIELRQSSASELEAARPVAIIEGSGAQRRVIACNETAGVAGVAAGMDVPAAVMREPLLCLLERSKADERRAMHAIASWAHQFSSDVCLDLTRWTLWLEVGASLRYFNGLSTVYCRIRDGITGLGYIACLGIAPTLEAAAVLARQSDALPVIHRSELHSALSPLPLTCLDLGGKVVDSLQAAGSSTIGDLLNIPRASLARRFGRDLPDYLQRMLGNLPDVRRRHRVPLVYRRRVDFMDGVESVEGLLFPLRRALQELEGYLRGRDVAIQRLSVTLRLGGAGETVLRLVTSAPQRDAIRLFVLLRERLERTQLAAPVTAIALAADEFVEPQITQRDFFDDHQRRNDSWSALLDKLRARLGDDAVRRLGLRDDHRPEKAWCIAADGKATRLSEDFPDRPLWLLDPTPLNSLPKLLGTPERIEAGWWADGDSSRDYYLARTEEGARWWLFREVGTNRWYLQGFWA